MILPGILLFVIGLLFLFLLDAILGLFLKDQISPRTQGRLISE